MKTKILLAVLLALALFMGVSAQSTTTIAQTAITPVQVHFISITQELTAGTHQPTELVATWDIPQTIAVIGYQVEAFATPLDNQPSFTNGCVYVKTILGSDASQLLEVAIRLFYVDGELQSNWRASQILMMPAGYGLIFNQGDSLYLYGAATARIINTGLMKAYWVVRIYYVEL